MNQKQVERGTSIGVVRAAIWLAIIGTILVLAIPFLAQYN